jgi:hypothetical protein
VYFLRRSGIHPLHSGTDLIGSAIRNVGGTPSSILDTAAAWAEQRGLAALTLTTHSDVPWNAPYYERLGFQIMAETQISDGFRRIREHEQARGLARWPRVTMRRPVGSQRLSH